MANPILTATAAKATLTCTLAALAAGSAQQSTMVNNSSTKYPAAILTIIIQTGAVAPTAGRTVDIYLLRGDDPASSTYRTDGAGATNAAITIVNAPKIGSIILTASTATLFYGDFDTSPLGPLGPEWGIAIMNNSDQALNASDASMLKGYVAYYPEVQ